MTCRAVLARDRFLPAVLLYLYSGSVWLTVLPLTCSLVAVIWQMGISRLVSLVPKPQVNLTRFHGVFAPNSKYRKLVTSARQGKRKKTQPAVVTDQTPTEKRASMTWAQRLKRVFNIEIETCDKCGGDVRIIASIEDPGVIQKILVHLDNIATTVATGLLPQSRAPPGAKFLPEALNLAGPDRSVARHPSSR